MNKFIGLFLLIMATNSFGATDQVPTNRTVTMISTYANIAFVHVSPEIVSTQGCSSSNNKVVEISFSTQKGKEIYAAVLAAAVAKKKIGMGIGGCSENGNPLVYRIDTIF